MRSPTSTATSGSGGRRSALLLLVSAVTAAALAVAASGPAAAAGGPELFTQFCPAGAGAGQCTIPRGVAVNPLNGHVYVLDQTNKRVSEFTAWGEFLRTWGWDVVASGPDDDTSVPANEFEICVPANGDVCKAGLSGAGVGQFVSPQGVALDSSGNVYVFDPPATARRVQKFSPTGEFLLMFGGGVNKTTGANVCSKADVAAGNVCGAGTTGTAAGQFGAVQAVGDYIETDSANHIYVGDVGRIQRFGTDGVVEPAAQITIAGESVNSLATDTGGNLYVTYINTNNNNKANVRKLSPAGAPLMEFAVTNPRSVAVAPTGNVYAFDKASKEIFQFNSAGSLLSSFGVNLNEGSTGLAATSACLDPGEVNVYWSGANANIVNLFGQAPHNPPCPPPSVAPSFGGEYAASVGTTSADLRAEINPRFWPTTYYLQYGTVDCAVGPCTKEPLPPGRPLRGEGSQLYTTDPIVLQGLMPGTEYHYRFVAVSPAGTTAGADRTFRTYLPEPFALPDRRAFELVSPPEKNSAEVGTPAQAGGVPGPAARVDATDGSEESIELE